MSFGRRNTDWQAWGQHRRRATARMAQKSREREIEEYQARFKRPAEKKEEKKMIWFVGGLAVLVVLGIWLELLARIVVLHMIGKCHDGYDDN